METAESRRIDGSTLVKLVEIANRNKNYHTETLGNVVSSIVEKAMKSKSTDSKHSGRCCFMGYTDDWKLEMYSDACLAVFHALPKAELNEKSIFNYLYTVAINQIKGTLNRLNGDLEKVSSYDSEVLNRDNMDEGSVFVRDKRRMLHGFFEKNKEKALTRIYHKKRRKLSSVIGKSARDFSCGLDTDSLLNLIEFTKKKKEAFA